MFTLLILVATVACALGAPAPGLVATPVVSHSAVVSHGTVQAHPAPAPAVLHAAVPVVKTTHVVAPVVKTAHVVTPVVHAAPVVHAPAVVHAAPVVPVVKVKSHSAVVHQDHGHVIAAPLVKVH